MNKSMKIIICMVSLVIVLFILDQVLNKEKKVVINSNDNYIVVKDIKMPSIYSTLGEKNIISVEEGSDNTGNFIKIKYSDLSILELSDYASLLKNLGYIATNITENQITIAKETEDKNWILTIDIVYTKTGTTIKYSKGTGVLVKN